MKLLFTGGGTGGHLRIAQTLNEAAIENGHETYYIGSTQGQDRAWFEHNHAFSSVYFLPSKPLVNQTFIHKVAAILALLFNCIRALLLIRKHNVDAVISVGGYSAAAASIAAILLRRKLFIQEQNAKVGYLNQKLRPFATAFYSAYEQESTHFSYPVSRDFYTHARVRKQCRCVIFLGGSQGAQAINTFALSVVRALRERGIKIIHQCGEIHYKEVKAAYEELGLLVTLVGFSSDMPALLHEADLAVARSGASTLWELVANQLPALYIPYPYAAQNHQWHNAAFLQEHDASWLCLQEQLTPQTLLSLLDEPLQTKSETLATLFIPNAADAIIADIISKTSRS